MKKIYTILVCLCMLAGFVACEKDKEFVLTTLTVTNETVTPSYETAEVSCSFKADATISEAYVQYSLSSGFAKYDIAKMTEEKGKYVAMLTGLQDNTTYYIRYAVSNKYSSVVTEEVVECQTLPCTVPTIVLDSIGEVRESHAKAYLHLTFDGGASVTDMGICWSKQANPTIEDIHKSTKDTVAVLDITELQENTKYYVRAYAVNKVGTAYSEELVFTTYALPKVCTEDVTDIQVNTALLSATLVFDGNDTATIKGFCWSDKAEPSINGNHIAIDTTSAHYTYVLTDLLPATEYHVRAYAQNKIGVVYGEEKTFTTTKDVVSPTVTTAAITQITETTAVAGGNVTSDGGASVTERGVVYATTQNPTTADNKVAGGSGVGTFTCNLTDLQPNTKYYVRAYAINSKGTAYGEEVTFTANKQVVLPSVTTATVTQITETAAVAGGNVTSDGGASVTERGVVYATTQNPTTNNIKVKSGTGTGSFTCNLTDLQPNTTYYVRAYAINSKGTAYGEEVSFTTKEQSSTEPGVAETITVNGVSFTMVAVEGGTFTMGATSEQGSDAYSDDRPTHSVTLSDFAIGETEVTQELWKAVMGSNPSLLSGTNLPVEKVSWNDCQTFISKLNNLTGKNFRLPTEAEWEYAARGGQKSQGYKYAGSNTLGDVAWYYDNSDSNTHPVKQKQANELGLYDMSGNVFEWCQDWYDSYSSSAQTNPTGSTSGSDRVYRGGSLSCEAGICRVSYRNSHTPAYYSSDLGLRLALGAAVELEVALPTVTTNAVTQITETTAVAGGNVTSDGNVSVTERGVVYGKSPNPTISNLNNTIRPCGSGMGEFTYNMTDLQPSTTYYVRAYATNEKGTAYGEEESFTTYENIEISDPTGTENGYGYVDLGLSVKWATMNVGASKAGDYGSHFAWGETTTKDTYNWSTYKYCNGSYNTLKKYNTSSSYGTMDHKTQLELSDDAARANWGGSWRIPTDAEWTELREQCTWTWTTQNGVYGYKVTSKKSGYANNSIFLPAAGWRIGSSFYDAGSYGDYWSSSLNTGTPSIAWGVDFDSSNVGRYSSSRYDGRSVRPVCP